MPAPRKMRCGTEKCEKSEASTQVIGRSGERERWTWDWFERKHSLTHTLSFSLGTNPKPCSLIPMRCGQSTKQHKKILLCRGRGMVVFGVRHRHRYPWRPTPATHIRSPLPRCPVRLLSSQFSSKRCPSYPSPRSPLRRHPLVLLCSHFFTQQPLFINKSRSTKSPQFLFSSLLVNASKNFIFPISDLMDYFRLWSTFDSLYTEVSVYVCIRLTFLRVSWRKLQWRKSDLMPEEIFFFVIYHVLALESR